MQHKTLHKWGKYLLSSSSRIFSSSHMKTPASAAMSFPVGACLLCRRRHMLLTSVHLLLSEYRFEYSSPIWRALLSLWPVTKLQWLAKRDNSLSFFFFSEASLFVPLPAFWSHDSSRPTRSPNHDLLLTAPLWLKVLKLCSRTALAPMLHTGRCWTEDNIFVSRTTNRCALLKRPELAKKQWFTIQISSHVVKGLR